MPIIGRLTRADVCQVKDCINLARYNLYKTNSNGEKIWLYVCVKHEKIIGDENMRRAGGRYNAKI